MATGAAPNIVFKEKYSSLSWDVLVMPEGGGKLAKAKAGDQVKVHYTGTLARNGKKFDSSRDKNKPFSFELGAKQVIAGWDQGVAGMVVGEKRLLKIPSALAYGHKAVGGGLIPADSDLVFEVELIAIL